MISQKFAFLCAIYAFAISAALAQAPNPDIAPGLQAFQSYQGGDLDNVDLQTGNLIVNIPLISYPQRGDKLKLSYSLVWNGKPWITYKFTDPAQESALLASPAFQPPPPPPPINVWAWVPNIIGPGLKPRLGWSVVDDQDVWTGGFWYNPINPDTGQEYGPFSVTQWGTSDGSIHSGVQVSGAQSGETAIDGSGFFNGLDQKENCSQYCYTIDSSGIAFYPEGQPGFPSTPGTLVVREDPNGNEITATDITTPGATFGQITSYTDTIGRVIPALPTPGTASTSGNFTGCSGSLPTYSSQDWDVPGANGSTITYRFCYALVAISLPAHCQVTTKTTASTQILLQSVVLPNKQTWTFAYNSSLSGDPVGTNYGDLSKITFPTGGTLAYTYLLLNGYTNTTCSMSVWTRTENANDGQGPHTTTYSGQYTGAATVTDAENNQTVHTFSNLGAPSDPTSPRYEVTTQTYQGSSASGTLLKTVQTAYNSVALNSLPSGGAAVGTGAFNVFPQQRTTTLKAGSSTIATVETMSYCCTFSFVTGTETENPNQMSYGLLSDDKVYDYSSGSTGALLKESQTQYYFQTNPSYLTANMISLPASRTILAGAQLANSAYTYDESTRITGAGVGTQHVSPLFAVRGNLSTTTESVNSTSTIQTHTNWYDTGVPYQSIDGRGNTEATFAYSSAYAGAFPTTVTNALAQPTTYSYDFNLGLKATSEDPNLQTTTYSHDNYGRLTNELYPDNGQMGYAYNDLASPVNVVITKLATPSPSVTEQVNVDGFGRVSRTTITTDPNGADNVDTVYDPVGRVSSVSNPYRTSTAGVTTYTYDALNRKTTQTQPDGSVIQWCYNDIAASAQTNCFAIASSLSSQSWVDYSDEAGNHWQRTYDALGRVTSVVEPNPSNNALSLETDYGYSGLGDLLSVKQNGVGGTDVARTRTFTYDEISRLVTASNPETGTICYGVWSNGTCTGGYDANGNLLYKSTPAPNAPATSAAAVTVTTNTYDALNRLLTSSHSDHTPEEKFTYDGGAAGSNSIGHATFESLTDPTGKILAQRSYAKFDPMGRLLNDSQCVVPNCPGTQYTPSYAYDLAGNVLTASNGIAAQPITLTYAHDGAGNLQQISSSLYDANRPQILFRAVATPSLPTYTAAGKLAYAQYGYTPSASTAAIVLTRGYDQRNRVLQENAETGSTSSYTFTMPSGYDGAGNPLAVNDSVGLQWTFTYDHLNRLSTAMGAGSFAGQGMSWTYDSFGNRKTQAITGADLQQYAANASYNNNNQATSTNLGAVGYDQAGNITNDGVNSYAIDAESRVCSYHTSVLNENWTNVYDAEGHRVAKGQVPSGSSCYTGSGFVPTETDVLGQSGEQFSTLTPSGWQNTNVYANGQLLATYEGGGVYFALNDWLGSKRKLVNGTGSTIENDMNLWFGDGTQFSGAPDASDHHFTGQLHDTQSGLDYFGARFYQSKMGRFLSPDWSEDPDPLPYVNLEDPQTLNLYGYVRNNPMSKFDPDGHFMLPPCGCPDYSELQWQIERFFHQMGVGFQMYYQQYFGKKTPVPPPVAPPADTAKPDPDDDKDKNNKKTDHAKERQKQAREGDSHRDVGDANRVIRDGRKFTDTDSGYDVHVRGNRVVVTDPNDGNSQVTQFKTTSTQTQANIESGKWQPK